MCVDRAGLAYLGAAEKEDRFAIVMIDGKSASRLFCVYKVYVLEEGAAANGSGGMYKEGV